MKGKFITVEGIEGVGKTTNIEYVRQLIDARGIDCTVTREPGGTPMAEEIRETLLTVREEAVCHKTELLLMFAARAQHLKHTILPRLSHGDWVVCDRFTDATYAYQGYGRKHDLSQIAQLEQIVQEDFRPDCTLLLDAPVEVGLARARGRGNLDRFEQEKVDFFERVREGYLAMAERSPERYHVVDASGSVESVQAGIKSVIDNLF
jgi:dTMP kinase